MHIFKLFHGNSLTIQWKENCGCVCALSEAAWTNWRPFNRLLTIYAYGPKEWNMSVGS